MIAVPGLLFTTLVLSSATPRRICLYMQVCTTLQRANAHTRTRTLFFHTTIFPSNAGRLSYVYQRKTVRVAYRICELAFYGLWHFAGKGEGDKLNRRGSLSGDFYLYLRQVRKNYTSIYDEEIKPICIPDKKRLLDFEYSRVREFSKAMGGCTYYELGLIVTWWL